MTSMSTIAMLVFVIDRVRYHRYIRHDDYYYHYPIATKMVMRYDKSTSLKSMGAAQALVPLKKLR